MQRTVERQTEIKYSACCCQRWLCDLLSGMSVQVIAHCSENSARARAMYWQTGQIILIIESRPRSSKLSDPLSATIPMDLPVIGSHCSLSSCKDLDLLPIRCQCGKLFCRHHISPGAHDCSPDLATQNPITRVTLPFEKCAAEKCKQHSLESFIGSALDEAGRSPATCTHCHKAFCVRSVAIVGFHKPMD
jgi:hypothetical protein